MKRGFTLLELIIVIAILAVLAVAVVIVLNPAEVLAKARDSNRLSDLSALKSAIALYLTDVSPPLLAGATSAADCTGTGGVTSRTFYSYPNTAPGADFTEGAAPTMGTDADGATLLAAWAAQVSSANVNKVDATGWVPVALTAISPAGSPPLSVMPVDPTNKIDDTTAPYVASVDDLTYRYACNHPKKLFQIVGNLESATYKNAGAQDRESTDGGQIADLYETGTALRIFPAASGAW